MFDLQKLVELQNAANQQLRGYGRDIDQALGGYPSFSLDKLEELANTPGVDLLPPFGVAPSAFPKLSVKEALGELFSDLRQFAGMAKNPSLRRVSLQGLKDYLLEYGPKFEGVYQGAKRTAEKAPEVVDNIKQVSSKLISPWSETSTAQMSPEGHMRVYPGAKGEKETIKEIAERMKITNLHEPIHQLQFGPDMGGKPFIYDYMWSENPLRWEFKGPLSEFLFKIPPEEELIPYFAKVYGRKTPQKMLSYLASPHEIMARGVAAEMYQRLHGFAGIENIKHPWYYLESWPQDLDPLWSKSADKMMKYLKR